jgi:superfamily II DNA or RNA helicase
VPGFICEERLTYGSWAALERSLARAIAHAGFTDVSLVGGSGDLGADAVGVLKGKRWVLQAKYRASGGVDSEGAREAIQAAAEYDADVSVLAANTYFSADAYEFQKKQQELGFDIRLWNGKYLLDFFAKLPEFSKKRGELRDYQAEAIDAVERRRGHGERHALVVMATGLGKSMIANQLMANELRRNPYQEVLVLAHMNDLVRQLEQSSWSQLPKDVSTHLWTDGEKPAYRGGVVFATWQSVAAAVQRGEEGLRGRFGLVIVDEAHHAPSEAFSRLLSDLEPNFLVGLTATPWRGDDRDLRTLFGEPAYTCDIVTGMQRGFLAAVDYRMLTDGIDWEEVSRASQQGLTVSDLNRHLLVPERDIGMVESICAKMSEMEEPRALAFCRSIEHAERLQPLFAARGIRAALMHSKLPRELRFKNLSAFRLGKIDMLISIEMLNEGIDVPDVNLVAFMRVTHSRRIFLQQLGRGLRVSPNKKKVVVLDFVADIRRVAAGIEINREAKKGAALPEVVRYKDGQIVKFDNDIPAKFFDEYLADVADVADLEEGSKLVFPGGEEF